MFFLPLILFSSPRGNLASISVFGDFSKCVCQLGEPRLVMWLFWSCPKPLPFQEMANDSLSQTSAQEMCPLNNRTFLLFRVTRIFLAFRIHQAIKSFILETQILWDLVCCFSGFELFFPSLLFFKYRDYVSRVHLKVCFLDSCQW